MSRRGIALAALAGALVAVLLASALRPSIPRPRAEILQADRASPPAGAPAGAVPERAGSVPGPVPGDSPKRAEWVVQLEQQIADVQRECGFPAMSLVCQGDLCVMLEEGGYDALAPAKWVVRQPRMAGYAVADTIGVLPFQQSPCGFAGDGLWAGAPRVRVNPEDWEEVGSRWTQCTVHPRPGAEPVPELAAALCNRVARRWLGREATPYWPGFY